jgi:putative hydrolase of the HAD superfamily
MITTVVFDLDDTLYDEVDFIRSGFRAAAEHLAGLSGNRSTEDVVAVMWDCFMTGDHGSTFDATLDRLGIPYDQNLIGKLVEFYRTHRPTLTLPPESRAVLDALKGKYTLGLLTDGYLPTQHLKVQALSIEHYFAAIVYTEELGRECWKPSPRGFDRLIELLHARPEQMAYIADNEAKDFIAPNQLGMLTIRLVRPGGLYTQTSPVPNAAPKLRLNRIEDLVEILPQH